MATPQYSHRRAAASRDLPGAEHETRKEFLPNRDPPGVTVVIPTHNRRRLLELTLESALRQRDVALEIVVVDDGSTDGTAPIVQGFGDDRIRLVRHEKPRGVSAARNKGIAEARGGWIAFLDDDDLWAPDKLALQLAAVLQTGQLWAYTGHVNITSDHRVVGGVPPSTPDDVQHDIRRMNLIPGGGSNVLARTDLVRRLGGFDEMLGILEDWDMWIRLAREERPAWVRRPLVGYRIHGSNSSRNIDRMLTEVAIIDRRYRGPVDKVRFYRHLARVSMRGGRRRQALAFSLHAALLGGPQDLARSFAPDVWEIANSFMPDRLRGRVGRIRRHHVSREQDEWATQAAMWLADLGFGSPTDTSSQEHRYRP
jgi:glycosyltransferase involved in cell wall biosynthesis